MPKPFAPDAIRGKLSAGIGNLHPHADALVAEADALLGFGKVGDALTRYEKALAVRPDCIPALNNRGVALRNLGRSAEALTSFDAALALEPGHSDALNNRAKALIDLGRAEEALDAFDRALVASPSRAKTFSNRGDAMRRLGRNEEALANYESAIALDARYADAHNNRGLALRALQRPEEARASFERALALLPGNAAVLVNIGHALMDLGLTADALSKYDLAIALRPDHSLAHDGRGNALAKLGRESEALASYDVAISLNPAAAPSYNNKGLALVQLGRVEEGSGFLKAAIARDGSSGQAFYNLSLSMKFEVGDEMLSRMEAFTRDASPHDVEGRIFAHFALGKAYADIGEFGASFQHFSAGNSLKRPSVTYEEAKTVDALAQTRALYSREALARFGGLGDPSAVPIFVFGMPRSGTTLVEQILTSHGEVHGAGEIKDFEMAAVEVVGSVEEASARPETNSEISDSQLRRIGSLYVERLRATAPPAKRIVDKMTENFRFAGLIALALPNARMIHVRRDPLDACLSCYSTLFTEALAYAYDLSELGRYYRAYEALMDHWRKALPPRMMLEVEYEDVIADVEGQSRRMFDHCGLGWDERSLDFHRNERSVRTASFAQVRRPLYATSVGRWRNYEAFLEPLIAALDSDGPRHDFRAPAPR